MLSSNARPFGNRVFPLPSSGGAGEIKEALAGRMGGHCLPGAALPAGRRATRDRVNRTRRPEAKGENEELRRAAGIFRWDCCPGEQFVLF